MDVIGHPPFASAAIFLNIRPRDTRVLYNILVYTGWAKKVTPLVHCNIYTKGITFLAHPVYLVRIEIYTNAYVI